MFDVIIIGFGRVGCPLGLSLEEHGLKVAAIDIDENIINSINNRKMPFLEFGYDEVLKNSKLKVIDGNKIQKYPESKAYIITVGTPLMQHIETDLSQVKQVINDLLEKADLKNKLIILRSTVAPETTQLIKKILENKEFIVGKNIFLAMCPERLAEGVAKKELTELPQLIGIEDDESFEKAKEIFSVLNVKIFKCTYIEAELSKLFTNIYRYINMSTANYFSYIAEYFNSDIFNIYKLMNTDYPRNKGLMKPGFSCGACVLGNKKLKIFYKKDGVIIEEFITYEELYNNFKQCFIESFNEYLIPSEKKEIKKCTKRKYTGKMYKIEFDDGSIFECTANHLIPIFKKNKIFITAAKNITTQDHVLRFF